jgi:hypothetical protein
VPCKEPKDTYVVLLSGTEFRKGQQTGLGEDVASSLNKDDAYRQSIFRALEDAKIKKTDNLIIAGHSLGGMEAQNLVADKRFQERYNATHVMTFGSPKTAEPVDGVQYHRYTTIGDPVPYASPNTLKLDRGKQIDVSDNQLADRAKAAVRPVGYGVHQHLEYPKIDALKKYDALGNKTKDGEGVRITLDTDRIKTYESKKGVQQDRQSGKMQDIWGARQEKAAAAATPRSTESKAPARHDDRAAERRALKEKMRTPEAEKAAPSRDKAGR